jgi:hypothetical protein
VAPEPERTLQHRQQSAPRDLDNVMNRVAAGDQDAFAALYDAIAPRAYGLIRRIMRDQALAEEVTQDVMVEVWRTAPRFDNKRGSAAGWILAGGGLPGRLAGGGLPGRGSARCTVRRRNTCARSVPAAPAGGRPAHSSSASRSAGITRPAATRSNARSARRFRPAQIKLPAVPHRLDRPQNTKLQHRTLPPARRPRAHTIVGHQHHLANR